MPTIVADVYARISRAPDGSVLGVERQVPPCRELIQAKGWQLGHVHVDNDLSAYTGQRRPGYEALLERLRTGQAQALVAWHPDRLTRQPRENEALIDLVERCGVQVATVQSGEHDLSTPAGRMHWRMLGVVARYESEHRAERVRLKMEQLARAGQLTGGGLRPFGYEPDRVTVRPEEAALVRDAARRVLAGESLRAIVRDWQAAGVLTPTGRAWGRQQLRRVLTSARIAGLKVYRGEVVAPAVWPAILDEPTWREVRALLEDERRRPPGWTTVRRYLLTGLATCGLCDRLLRPLPTRGGKRNYACRPGDAQGCGRISRLAEPVEQHVRDRVVVAVDDEVFMARLKARYAQDPDEDRLLAERRRIDRLLTVAEERYLEGEVRRETYLRKRAEYEQRLRAIDARLAAQPQRRLLASLPGSSQALLGAWDAADLSWRRQVVELFIRRVVILPAGRGHRRFDPSRIRVEWRA